MGRRTKTKMTNAPMTFHRDGADEMPERKLLAAVLLQAWQDCNSSDIHEAFSAFRWAVKKHPMFVAICEEMGASPDFVAERFEDQFGSRFKMGAVAA